LSASATGIKISFDSGLLFAVNKAELQSQAKANLGNLAKILSKHSDTDILGEGDTDNSAAPHIETCLIDFFCCRSSDSRRPHISTEY
jgi:outer membrane protein OmpA-like peptidoglycan-associated protein